MQAPLITQDVVPSKLHPVEVGRLVSGRYRLEALIARGAMGSIWRAQHVDLRCAVAIKFLDVSVGGETEMHSRFLQEGRSAAAVRCANVVQVFDYGTEGNIPFIVMELLDGETLEQRLSRCRVLSPIELDGIFRGLVSGVGRAHATGIIHRDLKPSNIFIAREGSDEVIKLLDFGIAKVDEARLGFTPRAGTRAGTVIGTPDYMSPEQLRTGTDIDCGADLWALGIVAFECLTGRLPFSAKSLTDLIVQICTETPVLPSTLAPMPAGFDRWFRKATHRDRGSRFSSAREMADALSPILRGGRAASVPERVETRIDGAPARANPSDRIRAVLRWAGATLAWPSRLRVGLGLAMLVVVIVVVSRPVRQLAPAAEAQAPGVAMASDDTSPDLVLLGEPHVAPEGAASGPPHDSPSIEPSVALAALPSTHSAEADVLPRPSAAPSTLSRAPTLGKGSAQGQTPKRVPERRPSSSTPSLPSRTTPDRPAAVDSSPSPPVSDGDALFAERQ